MLEKGRIFEQSPSFFLTFRYFGIAILSKSGNM